MAVNTALLKTILISVVTPLVIAIVGVVGNNQLTSWRLEDLETNSANKYKVVSIEKKLDEYIALQNESNKLMLSFLTQKGARVYTKMADNKTATREDQVDIYYAYQADMLLKRMDQLETKSDKDTKAANKAETKMRENNE